VTSDTDKKFVNDLGFDQFCGSLGNNYTAAIQAPIAELLGNSALCHSCPTVTFLLNSKENRTTGCYLSCNRDIWNSK